MECPFLPFTIYVCTFYPHSASRLSNDTLFFFFFFFLFFSLFSFFMCSSFFFVENRQRCRVSFLQTQTQASSPLSLTDRPIHHRLTELRLLPQEHTVVLQWIPAHCGIPDNERADCLEANNHNPRLLHLPGRHNPAPAEKSHWTIQPVDRSTNHLARHGQTTVSTLRTGHCSLRAYLKRTNIMVSALCDSTEPEQTIHDILQDCSLWWRQRYQLWPQVETTTNKLRGTVEDLRRTNQFLAACGLRV